MKKADIHMRKVGKCWLIHIKGIRQMPFKGGFEEAALWAQRRLQEVKR